MVTRSLASTQPVLCRRSSELVFVDQPMVLVFIIDVAAGFEVIGESLEPRPDAPCDDLPRRDVVVHEDDLAYLPIRRGGEVQAMVVAGAAVGQGDPPRVPPVVRVVRDALFRFALRAGKVAAVEQTLPDPPLV